MRVCFKRKKNKRKKHPPLPSRAAPCGLPQPHPSTLDSFLLPPRSSKRQETAELQRQLGANIEVDVAYQYLTFFLDDDAELADIGARYAKGEMMTGEVKGRLIELLHEMVQAHQARREAVTDEVLAGFMAVRPLEF